jgi:hypothetical protein
MRDIDKELHSWNIHDLEAQESMLRGCVGLDVTGFFFMSLVRLCDLLTGTTMEQDGDNCQDKVTNSEREKDIVRLISMIRVLQQDEKVKLQGRLESVLQSKDLAADVVGAVGSIIDQTFPGDNISALP